MTQPTHITTNEPRLREGQQWRDATGASTTANIITIETIEPGSGAVHGVYRPEGTEALGAGVWSSADFLGYVLIADPAWSTISVAAGLNSDDHRADAVTRSVGMLAGSRSMTLPTSYSPSTGPESCWNIVAPSDDEALALVTAFVGDDVHVRLAPNWSREP